jgi:selenocysteine lyase/cysteine desulfurase
VNDRSRELLRTEFPLLRDTVYLNSNSTGLVPRGAQAVLQDYWQTLAGWRDEAWEGWIEQLHGYVAALSDLIGAPQGSVVTEANLTTLLGRIATSLDFTGPRNRVVTSDLEFPTMPFFWRGFARYGADLDVVGSGGFDFDIDALEAAIDERTALVCISHVSCTTGAMVDIERIIQRAHAHGALVVLDAFQSVGTVPLDVTALDVDFVMGGAHKWMCGTHTAFLYVHPSLIPHLHPAVTGWFAGDAPLTFRESAGLAPDAQRFAGGTPIPLMAMISRVGLDLLADIGIDDVRVHSLRCTDRIIERADAAGFAVHTPRAPQSRGGMVNLAVPDSYAVKRRLAEQNVICSWRDGLRVAPHVYTTLDEVDTFMDALEKAAIEMAGIG